jgi:superoxide reductase
MVELKTLLQTADWKQEKHVPVIDSPASVKKGDTVRITVSVGKQIAHPNKTEHHIRWITVYFQPRGEKFPYNVGKFDFDAHGESAQGPDTSTVYTNPEVVASFKTEKPGTILAVSYCNIHGLWESSKEIEVT